MAGENGSINLVFSMWEWEKASGRIELPMA